MPDIVRVLFSCTAIAMLIGQGFDCMVAGVVGFCLLLVSIGSVLGAYSAYRDMGNQCGLWDWLETFD